MSETAQPEILSEQRDGVLWLTLNRPAKANAMNVSMMSALADRISAAASDATVRAVAITGSGTRVFSGGVDVRSPSPLPPKQHARQRSEQFFRLLNAGLDFAKPLVAAVNGVASGGGLMLALSADRVVAAEHASVALPEIDLGSPTYAGMAMVSHFAGGTVSADLALSGRRMSARDAYACGLIAELAPDDVLHERAQQAALMLAEKPPGTFALSKRWLNRPLIAALAQAQRESEATRAAEDR